MAGTGFYYPVGVAVAKDGHLYVANRVFPHITKATIDEEFICEFGRPGQEEGQFVWLTDVALDRNDNVYTADEWLHRITKFDKDGNLMGAWGEHGEGKGQLDGPTGLAFDADDNLWVVNSSSSRVEQFTKDGKYLGGFGTMGSGDSELDMPWGITIDNQGDIYIADWNNHRVQKFAPGGRHLLTFGSGERTGVSVSGGTPYHHATLREFGVNPNSLNHPTGVAVDGEGDVYVVDWMNERVVIFNAEAKPMATLRGEASGLSKWGEMSILSNPDMGLARRRVTNPEVQNFFRMPVACTFDRDTNRLIVCDTQRGRLQIFEKDKEYKDPQFNL